MVLNIFGGIAKGIVGGFGDIAGLVLNAGKILIGVIKTFDKFPMNIVVGLILILLELFKVLVGVPGLRDIISFFVYIIPYVLRLVGIYLRYAIQKVNTAIAELIERKFGVSYKKFLIFLQSCNPDPRQWFVYPQQHFGNTHETRLGTLCMNPCSSKYIPYFGGLFCRKADRRLPRYCPKAMIMRSLEGLQVDGQKNFSKSKVFEIYNAACAQQNIPLTTFEEKYGTVESASEALTRAVCQQPSMILGDPSQVSYACHEVYCKKGNREPFCTDIDPTYSDGMDNDLLQLLRIPFMILVSAFIIQMTRYIMWENQKAFAIKYQNFMMTGEPSGIK